MKKAFFYFCTLWGVLWMQVASNHFLGGTLFSVQWILIAVLHFGLMRGPWMGESVGFIWGLLMDASSMGMLGVHAILYTLAGFSAGMLRRQLDASKLSTQAVFTWIVSLMYVGLYMLFERIFSLAEGTFQWGYLTVPIVNGLAAPLVFTMLDRWAELWDMAPTEY